jgi:hypothetical protein
VVLLSARDIALKKVLLQLKNISGVYDMC